jgi:RNA polymerase sigma-70 factor, ECF subfamily
MDTSTESANEQFLLEAAQAGDDEAFRVLVQGRRAELHAHCYRMLASWDDADDALQEALIRAWKGLPRFEGRSSLRTWLFTITSNVALDLASRRARRELPVAFASSKEAGESPDATGTEIPWIDPYAVPSTDSSLGLPEARYAGRESIELAFVAALQYLPAHQRGVFILREALGFTAVEAANILETSVAAVNSALQRARVAVRDRIPIVSQQEELGRLGDAKGREIAAQYAAAIEESDVAALLCLLSEDATWSMPPEASWLQGHDDIEGYLRGAVFPKRWHHVTTAANGQLAVAGYIFNPDRDAFVANTLNVLDLRNGLIAAVTAFRAPGLFERFGLPARQEDLASGPEGK